MIRSVSGVLLVDFLVSKFYNLSDFIVEMVSTMNYLPQLLNAFFITFKIQF